MFPRFNQTTLRRTALWIAVPVTLCAQTPPMLTLQQAEEMAVKNHPQIQAAQNEVNFANQQIVINRAPYYPDVKGDITGTQGNNLARIGAGDLPASRLFDREAQGVVVQQLITDSGRTHNLVASARFQAQASAQDARASGSRCCWM
jgi:outer membrane protein TolC